MTLLTYHVELEISLPDCKLWFTARNRPSSNTIITADATRLQPLIAEPKTKMRTPASTAKNKTNAITPTIRFFSLSRRAWRNAGDALRKC